MEGTAPVEKVPISTTYKSVATLDTMHMDQEECMLMDYMDR